MVHQHLAAHHLHAVRTRLPHLPWAEARILERADERLDVRGPPVQRGRREDRTGQGKPLNPLRGPLRPHLGARDAPDLFRVGLEEDLVQAPPEPVGHPLVQRVFHRRRIELRVEVAEHAARRIHDAEAHQRVLRAERVVEILAAVEDAGLAGHVEEVVAEDLLPEFLHGRDLREEAMPADVEPVSLVLRRLGDASDLVRPFQHRNAIALLCGQVRSGESGRPASDHDEPVTGVQARHPPFQRGRGVRSVDRQDRGTLV